MLCCGIGPSAALHLLLPDANSNSSLNGSHYTTLLIAPVAVAFIVAVVIIIYGRCAICFASYHKMQMWPGDTRHSPHPAASIALDEVGEGIGPIDGGRNHQGSAQWCHRSVLSGDHCQTRRSGSPVMQQRSAYAQDGYLRH